nr:MAG TPA: hypothetical protein [Caudoviricetes sp.]
MNLFFITNGILIKYISIISINERFMEKITS